MIEASSIGRRSQHISCWVFSLVVSKEKVPVEQALPQEEGSHPPSTGLLPSKVASPCQSRPRMRPGPPPPGSLDSLPLVPGVLVSVTSTQNSGSLTDVTWVSRLYLHTQPRTNSRHPPTPSQPFWAHQAAAESTRERKAASTFPGKAAFLCRIFSSAKWRHLVFVVATSRTIHQRFQAESQAPHKNCIVTKTLWGEEMQMVAHLTPARLSSLSNFLPCG